MCEIRYFFSSVCFQLVNLSVHLVSSKRMREADQECRMKYVLSKDANKTNGTPAVWEPTIQRATAPFRSENNWISTIFSLEPFRVSPCVKVLKSSENHIFISNGRCRCFCSFRMWRKKRKISVLRSPEKLVARLKGETYSTK